MHMQQPSGTSEAGAPAVRSWLLLVLLVVLPVSVALASPEPLHMPGGDAVQHDGHGHVHTPFDTPTCHHAGHHANMLAVVSDNREAELPAPEETVAALPSHGPTHEHLTMPDEPLHAATSGDPRTTLPVYLRTRRLRL